jgi:hypothetical protein
LEELVQLEQLELGDNKIRVIENLEKLVSLRGKVCPYDYDKISDSLTSLTMT